MPKPYEKPTGKPRTIKKNDRLLARENWVSGLTDAENAKTLGLFKENGDPNDKAVARWRENSVNPKHATAKENWFVYRDEVEAKQVEMFLLQRQNYERSRLADTFEKQKQFNHNHLLTIELFERMLRAQFIPQQSPDGSTIMPNADKDTVKTLSEGYNLYRQIAADKQRAILPNALQEEILAIAEEVEEDARASGFDDFISKMNSGAIEVEFVEKDPAYFSSLKKNAGQLTNLIELSSEKKKVNQNKKRLSS